LFAIKKDESGYFQVADLWFGWADLFVVPEFEKSFNQLCEE